MATKLTREQESNIQQIKKLLDASLVLDLFVWAKYRGGSEKKFVSITRSLNKMVTSTSLKRRVVTYVINRWSGKRTRQAEDETSYMYWNSASVRAHKRMKELKLWTNLSLEQLKLATTTRNGMPTNEDKQWAKAVFDNYEIAYSDLEIGDKSYAVEFKVMVPMYYEESVHADSLEEAQELAKKLPKEIGRLTLEDFSTKQSDLKVPLDFSKVEMGSLQEE